jgi:hypothetical protein
MRKLTLVEAAARRSGDQNATKSTLPAGASRFELLSRVYTGEVSSTGTFISLHQSADADPLTIIPAAFLGFCKCIHNHETTALPFPPLAPIYKLPFPQVIQQQSIGCLLIPAPATTCRNGFEQCIFQHRHRSIRYVLFLKLHRPKLPAIFDESIDVVNMLTPYNRELMSDFRVLRCQLIIGIGARQAAAQV